MPTPALSITVLGSGTAVPEPDRFPAGYLVRGGGATVLVDCGPGILRRLAQAKVGLEDIGAILLTHFHTDHTADLAAFLFALRNPRYRGRAPLLLLGARGLEEWLAHLTAAWPWLRPRGDDYVLEVREIEPGEHRIADLAVGAFPVNHTAHSLAYRLSAGGAVATLSGDADEGAGLVDAARAADLFVCDSAFPDALYQPGHLTPGRAGAIAAQAGARTLCLTHFYPECRGVDLMAQARATFAGRVVLAQDLLRFDLAGR
ncbi:MAG TPA: ribonuclease Z [Planctomycetota bacterium]|nr:ribonuclease Z [Planctomycetota bacterium]